MAYFNCQIEINVVLAANLIKEFNKMGECHGMCEHNMQWQMQNGEGCAI